MIEDRITGRLEDLFPTPVIALEATAEMWWSSPKPEEERSIRAAVSARRREFAAGRACARAALSRLGFPDATLPSGEDRLVRWPTGVIGSISHCRNRCAVAVAPRGPWGGVGLDLERLEPLDPEIVAMVAQRGELGDAARIVDLSDGETAKVLFSVKEAVYKACFPVLRERWEFSDVTVRLAGAGFEAATPAGTVSGRYASSDGWIMAGAVIPATQLVPRRASSAFR